MAVTNLGKCFARGIHAGTLTLIEIPDKHLQNTKDSYLELFGVPVEAAEQQVVMMEATILTCFLDCGVLLLLLTIERRFARMETRMSLCESCPITGNGGKKE